MRIQILQEREMYRNIRSEKTCIETISKENDLQRKKTSRSKRKRQLQKAEPEWEAAAYANFRRFANFPSSFGSQLWQRVLRVSSPPRSGRRCHNSLRMRTEQDASTHAHCAVLCLSTFHTIWESIDMRIEWESSTRALCECNPGMRISRES
jgi:hypothetical protein